jgi:UDP-N-acetylmuramoyl-tripeptide--D-alanyl-D-alanine ligase
MTTPLWTGPDLITALGARLVGTMPAIVTGASIDTRSLAPGDVFFALIDQRDGHAFVGAAFAAGASLAVVDEAHAAALAGLGPLAVVDDVLRAMERAGMARRAALHAGVIAITGSVGKTGTKEALRLALSRQGPDHGPRRLVQQPLGRAADAGTHAARQPLCGL